MFNGHAYKFTLFIQVNIKNKDGQPCDSVKGICALYRPSDANLDIPETELLFIGAGRYLLRIPRSLEHGLWNAVVDLRRESSVYVNRIPFMIP